ncbi:MAG TPA: sigma-70 family RNA polymerase sigma factor [Miltoncostaea sp.]|nr:sigma-70 family RNA polymerase sigma factor [Miltoncostaea sp.]
MTTDAELLRRAHDDPAAFRRLYERHAAAVHAYHLRRTGAPDAAEDLTAETFAQAWTARRRFRDAAGGSAAPWLFGIARHVLLASVRRRRLELRACARLGVMEELDRAPSGAVPHEAWLEGLDKALDDLPPDQREAIRLRVEEDLSYDDAARRVDATPQVVRARVSRGLRTLRTRLDATGGDR